MTKTDKGVPEKWLESYGITKGEGAINTAFALQRTAFHNVISIILEGEPVVSRGCKGYHHCYQW